jgi:hypothetical protein
MMGVSVKRIVRDTKGRGVAALQRRLSPPPSRALIGVPSGKETADGTSLALVAATVEFGHTAVHPDQPERPFLRGGVRSALPLCKRIARHDLAAVAEGEDEPACGPRPPGADGGRGGQGVHGWRPLRAQCPATIAAKGSAQPTIDIGQLRQSVTSVVE